MIMIDPGHGGRDSGAVHGSFREKEWTLDYAYQLRIALRDLGAQCMLTREYDDFVSLANRRGLANRGSALVSIHFNADPDDDGVGTHEARGWELYYNEKGEALAKAIDVAFKPLPLHRRGIFPNATLYVLKANVPAVLIEVAFIDSAQDLLVVSSPDFRRMWARSVAVALTSV